MTTSATIENKELVLAIDNDPDVEYNKYKIHFMTRLILLMKIGKDPINKKILEIKQEIISISEIRKMLLSEVPSNLNKKIGSSHCTYNTTMDLSKKPSQTIFFVKYMDHTFIMNTLYNSPHKSLYLVLNKPLDSIPLDKCNNFKYTNKIVSAFLFDTIIKKIDEHINNHDGYITCLESSPIHLSNKFNFEDCICNTVFELFEGKMKNIIDFNWRDPINPNRKIFDRIFVIRSSNIPGFVKIFKTAENKNIYIIPNCYFLCKGMPNITNKSTWNIMAGFIKDKSAEEIIDIKNIKAYKQFLHQYYKNDEQIIERNIK